MADLCTMVHSVVARQEQLAQDYAAQAAQLRESFDLTEDDNSHARPASNRQRRSAIRAESFTAYIGPSRRHPTEPQLSPPAQQPPVQQPPVA